MNERVKTLSELPDDAIACRSFRHAFVTTTDLNVVLSVNGQVMQFTRHAVCVTCQTRCMTTYEVPSMRRVKAKYIYPDKYLLDHREVSANAKTEYLDRMLRGGDITAERSPA